jgi:maleylpyruvate isomerase
MDGAASNSCSVRDTAGAEKPFAGEGAGAPDEPCGVAMASTGLTPTFGVSLAVSGTAAWGGKMSLTLHGYWRSTASYRVRIALNYKGLDYEQVTHDLRVGAHKTAGFLAIAPQGLVPVLSTGDAVLTQSSAVLEWLEESWPVPPLLPSDPMARAQVRGMASLVSCDIHPLNNLRVLRVLRSDLHASETQVQAWISGWITEGFAALEQLIGAYGGKFAFGDEPTHADCVLVPQVYAAERFQVDLDPFPRLRRGGGNAAALPAFAAAHPSTQPDADPR